LFGLDRKREHGIIVVLYRFIRLVYQSTKKLQVVHLKMFGPMRLKISLIVLPNPYIIDYLHGLLDQKTPMNLNVMLYYVKQVNVHVYSLNY
jgi:hypothetical protein